MSDCSIQTFFLLRFCSKYKKEAQLLVDWEFRNLEALFFYYNFKCWFAKVSILCRYTGSWITLELRVFIFIFYYIYPSHPGQEATYGHHKGSEICFHSIVVLFFFFFYNALSFIYWRCRRTWRSHEGLPVVVRTQVVYGVLRVSYMESFVKWTALACMLLAWIYLMLGPLYMYAFLCWLYAVLKRSEKERCVGWLLQDFRHVSSWYEACCGGLFLPAK